MWGEPIGMKRVINIVGGDIDIPLGASDGEKVDEANRQLKKILHEIWLRRGWIDDIFVLGFLETKDAFRLRIKGYCYNIISDNKED